MRKRILNILVCILLPLCAKAQVDQYTEEQVADLHCPNQDLRNVLRYVADKYELDLVIPDTLYGQTSLNLRQVTWRQAFKVILDPIRYKFIQRDGIVRIFPEEDIIKYLEYYTSSEEAPYDVGCTPYYRLDSLVHSNVLYKEASLKIVEALKASKMEPEDFWVRLEMQKSRHILVFHLWHKSIFPLNTETFGDPSGLCRTVEYSLDTRKIVRISGWR